MRRIKSRSSKGDVKLQLHVDPSFTGVLRGMSNDVSDGCGLRGICTVHVYRGIKIERLVILFEGRCKVKVKSSGNVTVPAADGSETRSLISRDKVCLDRERGSEQLLPGKYSFPFEFNLPPHLPASFKGKRGQIRYRLHAIIQRTGLSNDIQVSQEITLRRCLLDDNSVYIHLTETVDGKDHPDKINYSANAPSMVYREGGLLPLNLTMQLLRPDCQTVRSVTCALRERIVYQTTGQQSLSCQGISKTDDLFPLGWSTFYPPDDPKFRPDKKQDYNAVFRLCPRVNADTRTKLLRVSHEILVNIVVEETKSGSSNEDDQDKQAHHFRPSLKRSSSSSSLSSILSFGRGVKETSAVHAEEGAKDVSGSLAESISLKRKKHESKLFYCTLKLPIIVTSRDRYWEGDMPTPPEYQPAEAPPSYCQSLQQLPPVPFYPQEAGH